MTIGQRIRDSRKATGVTAEGLGRVLGLSPSAIWKIEHDALKGGPAPETIIRIADALGDQSILTYALMHNPICQRIIPRAFRPLNNIKTDPSAILAKIQEELEEAIEASKILSRIFAHKEPSSQPAYKETLFANLEQILDVSRGIEEFFDNLKASGVLSEEEHLEVHVRQQAKVEQHGHHKPEVEEG